MDVLGSSFLDIATRIALASLLVAFALTVYRLVRGPSFADRVVALDMLMLIGIGFIGVMAVVTSEYNYIDVGIALALVGFLATVAFARYIYRRAHLPKDDQLDEVAHAEEREQHREEEGRS